jgi:hypothetical protein
LAFVKVKAKLEQALMLRFFSDLDHTSPSQNSSVPRLELLISNVRDARFTETWLVAD